MSPPITVVLADDHAPTRADLRALLEEDDRFAVVGEADDAPGAVAVATRELPDLAVVDVNMPGGGVAAAWEIARRVPECALAMLTVSEADADLFSALRAGATGYLLKTMPRTQLRDALAELARGRPALPPELLTRVLHEYRDRDPHRRSAHLAASAVPLTSREWQVLDLLQEGRTTAQIARRLDISSTTVRSHISHLRHKLEADDRRQLLGATARSWRSGTVS